MPVTVIEERAGLEQLVQRALGADRIGIDLEGDGLFRYRARLCTMQLRVGEQSVVVDTLAVWEPALVAQLLGPDGPVKVIHDAAFDARLLRDHGVALGNVFDTALAARYLGEPATGLQALVAAHCDGVVIDKGPQQADWGKRPLDAAALGYLEADVAHLFALHDGLRARLRETDIEPEYEAEVQYMLGQALKPPPPPPPPWRRIKGAMDLDAVSQAVLRELSLVREQAAQTADVPVFRVLHDRVLVALAQRKPRDVPSLRKVRGATSGRAGGMAQAWLAAVSRGIEAGQVPADGLPPSGTPPTPAERALRKARHAALSSWRRATAEARGVDLQVVLPGHCLQDLCGLPQEQLSDLSCVEGIGARRLQRDAAALRQILEDTNA